MKIHRILLFSLLALVVPLSFALAQPETVPGTCAGISVSRTPGSGGANSFRYNITINNDATFTPQGMGVAQPVLEVFGIEIAPKGSVQTLSVITPKWTSFVTATAFGFETIPNTGAGIPPPNTPGSRIAFIGEADFTSAPGGQTVTLLTRFPGDDSSGFGTCQMDVVDNPCPSVPEPGTLALLGAGLVPLAGLLKRKKV